MKNLINELKERKAFLENTDCISEALEIEHIINICEKHSKNKIHTQVEKLIPYIQENFISYPLWEEGVYIPCVNFWKMYYNLESKQKAEEIIKSKTENTPYQITIEEEFNKGVYHVEYSMWPKWDWKNNGESGNGEHEPPLQDWSYEYETQDWSIEEIIELIGDILNTTQEKT